MDNKLVLNAAHFAARKHRDQRRKDVESSPYINHPISVAKMLADVGGVGDSEILAAALLHDTLEDTDTAPDELEAQFGQRVRKLVEEVTDNKTLPKEVRKARQIEHAAHISEGAVLIKLGDKISNVMDVTETPPSDWSLERRKEYLDWAEAVINNCSNVNGELKKHFDEVLARGRKVLLSP